MDFQENTKVTHIIDYKNNKVEYPNPYIEALKALGIIMGIFLVLFVLCFSQEILRAFG